MLGKGQLYLRAFYYYYFFSTSMHLNWAIFVLKALERDNKANGFPIY